MADASELAVVPPLAAAHSLASSSREAAASNESAPRSPAPVTRGNGADLPVAQPVVRALSPDSPPAGGGGGGSGGGGGGAADPPVGNAHPHTPLLARVLQYFGLGLAELRLLMLVLPCATVLLFVSGHQIAGGVVLAVTLLLTLAVCWRLTLLLRLRRHQYDSVPGFRSGVPLELLSLGHAARSARSPSISALRAHALRNPTAVRLAMMDRDFTPADYEMLGRLDEEHKAQVFSGVPSSQIARLPTFTVPKRAAGSASGQPADSTEHICAICLEERAEGQEVRALLCGHIFHSRSCIDKWLSTSRKCPTCQLKVEL